MSPPYFNFSLSMNSQVQIFYLEECLILVCLPKKILHCVRIVPVEVGMRSVYDLGNRKDTSPRAGTLRELTVLHRSASLQKVFINKIELVQICMTLMDITSDTFLQRTVTFQTNCRSKEGGISIICCDSRISPLIRLSKSLATKLRSVNH